MKIAFQLMKTKHLKLIKINLAPLYTGELISHYGMKRIFFSNFKYFLRFFNLKESNLREINTKMLKPNK